uniref:Sugar phosphate transporter domain-containing protein n=1 Tax=Hanusia phi TaxID=3032 RepID=A0A7S0EDN4_9CRYP|mmetsp:Transcript_22310/g.50315  ORF Transcript_22310/g.50315 Transcript_22310/m.50315 type:complete len:402 (+) Transcript_22310:47-1252(+)
MAKRIADHPFYGLFVATAYGIVSITITLFNKAVFSFYKFKYPMTLFVFQMLFSLIFVTLLKFISPKQFGFPGPEWSMAKKLTPMALGWWVYGISGVIALKYLNVPMFSAFRRFTTVIVMYGEYRLYGTKPPPDQRNAVFVMSAGAAIAGLTDLTFSLPGYFWVLTCAVSTALYLLFISKLGKESGLNDFGLLFYNNLLAFPFMLVSLFLSGELNHVTEYPNLHDLDFQIFFVVSAMQAFFLNFLIFFCTRVNSPLITSVTGTVKDLVTNGLGMTLFGDFPFNIPNIMSIVVCFAGSVWYSRLKYIASSRTRAEASSSNETKVVEMEEGLEQQASTGGSLQPQETPQYGAAEAARTPTEPSSRPAQSEQDKALLERKKALEQQLKELEQQLNAQPANVHHDD